MQLLACKAASQIFANIQYEQGFRTSLTSVLKIEPVPNVYLSLVLINSFGISVNHIGWQL